MVDFDLSGVFNADVVLNDGPSGRDLIMDSVVFSGRLRFASRTVADTFCICANAGGLPDDASFVANNFHPAVQLAFRNSNDGLNAVHMVVAGSVRFDVSPNRYQEVHAFATSGEGRSVMLLRFHYGDGTSEAAERAVPDWCRCEGEINQTADLYYLAQFLSTIDGSNIPNTSLSDRKAIYGLRFTPDPSKELTSISIEYAAGSGMLVVFGATGILSASPVVADTTPPVITATVSGTQGNGDWYTSDVAVSWTLTDPESAINSITDCVDSTIVEDTAGVSRSCTVTSFGGTASKTVTLKRDATPPNRAVPGDVAVQVVDEPSAAVSYTAGA